MDLPRLEHDIRQVRGVLACQVSGGEVVVLVAPDADADAVSGAVAALLTAAAASPVVRVVGGRSPIVPMRRRHGRRAVAAFSAGAAALAAAGVAAATNGVFTPDRSDRPSVSSEVAAPPTTLGAAPGVAPSPSSGRSADDGLRYERRARSTSPTTTVPHLPGSDVQSDRQLATLGVGPAVLAFDIPLPGEVAAPPVAKGPKKDAPAGPPPAPAPAAEVATTSTVAPTTTTTTTTTLPVAGTPSASTPTAAVDAHDNDRGERGTDSNGHDTEGPQREGWTRGRRD